MARTRTPLFLGALILGLALAPILVVRASPATSVTDLPAPLRTLYVSPSGSDSNPGTAALPWKSFNKAMTAAIAGDDVSFANGTYNETAYSNFGHGGTGTPGQSDFHPIVLHAASARGATLNFQNRSNQTAIWLIGTANVVLKDFVMTKPAMGSNYDDGLVRCWPNSHNCWVLGNEFRNSYEPVKASGNTGTRIEGNLFTAPNVAIGSFGATNITISTNTITNPGMDGIQTKGGTTNATVANNTITTDSSHRMNVGIYLGGGSCGSACGVSNVQTGYEGTNVQATGNTITSGGSAPGYGTMVFEGCDGCSASGNFLTNAGSAFRLIDNRGWPQPGGGSRIVPTRNASMTYNTINGCSSPLSSEASTTGTTVWSGNIMQNCPPGQNSTATATPTSSGSSTSTPVPTSTSTSTATPVPTATATVIATATTAPASTCSITATLDGVVHEYTRPLSFCTDQ